MKKIIMLFITGLVNTLLCFSPVPTVGATHKILYLTFDDGPSQRYTPQVLNILKREHVHATFFVLGFRCDEFPELVSRIHTEGHEIGNHGYYHRFIIGQSRTELESDLLRTDKAVFHACGIKPKYFGRPGEKRKNHFPSKRLIWAIQYVFGRLTQKTGKYRTLKRFFTTLQVQSNPIQLFFSTTVCQIVDSRYKH